MVPTLPKAFALKSSHNNKYLAYVPGDVMTQGFLKFSADDLSTDLTRFEVVESKNADDFVHIKCSYNNKYWTRGLSNLYWIAAVADVPDENLSKWSCTLFKPVFVNGNATTLQLRHVQLYRNVFSNGAAYEPYTHCLSTEVKTRDENYLDIFTIIDLSPVLPETKMPALLPRGIQPRGIQPQGIQPRGIQPRGIQLEDAQIHAIIEIDERSSKGVSKGPAVKKYEIVDVKFDLKKANVNYLETEETKTNAPIRNDGYESVEREVLFEYDRMEYSSWKSHGENSTINEMDRNAVTEIRSAVPFIFDEKNVLLGDEFTGPYKWGHTLDSESTVKTSYKIIVPAKTRILIVLTAKKANLVVPFTYTRRDFHHNGGMTPNENLNGEYQGVHYLYNFEVKKIEVSELKNKR